MASKTHFTNYRFSEWVAFMALKSVKVHCLCTHRRDWFQLFFILDNAFRIGILNYQNVTRYWCNPDVQAPMEHTPKSGRGEPLALLPRMLCSTGIPSLWPGNPPSSWATRISLGQEQGWQGSVAGPDGWHPDVPH